jgi:hypothetical protein
MGPIIREREVERDRVAAELASLTEGAEVIAIHPSTYDQ